MLSYLQSLLSFFLRKMQHILHFRRKYSLIWSVPPHIRLLSSKFPAPKITTLSLHTIIIIYVLYRNFSNYCYFCTTRIFKSNIMKKLHLNLLIVLLLLTPVLVCSCQKEFISDKAYRQTVENDFAVKQKQMPDGNLFEIFNQEMSAYEKGALKFLYAYMPMADITDYPGEFHLMNVRASEQAKAEMPWGKTVPELLFRHFVLPVRVNNEHLDSARVVFYKELKDRVKELPMKEAILEVNHWCHEKAVYRPSDARTSSPLATVKTAYGRCGEESTFLVAALRSVGIPARQVYTPRWAHTDDNHAWVEAWADGKWYFLGACEPEPVLDLAWFNAPASRGMLMHTKVFGKYAGKEEVMSTTPTYTEINVIENYAPTATALVKVVDAEGKPADNALVEFKLYNYAEFYSIAKKHCNKEGICQLTAGKGDVLVWASKDGKFGYKKLSFGKDNEIEVCLDKDDNSEFSFDIDIMPPVETANIPAVTEQQRKENDRRLAREDSIRNAYIATFMKKGEGVDEYMKEALTPENIGKLDDFMVASRGNYEAIKQFIRQAIEKGEGNRAVEMLAQLSEKDLRDANPEVLLNQLIHTPEVETAYFNNGLLNPRISTEELTPYKEYFQKNLPEKEAGEFKKDPNSLVKWCISHIALNDTLNSRGVLMSPEGVWKAKMADRRSRDVFFVAVARSLGIPSWIDPITGKVRYVSLPEDEIRDVDFEKGKSFDRITGVVKATFTPTAINDNPKYYSHFTISKLENGRLVLQNYDEGYTTWANLLRDGCRLDVGNYLLVTGTRLASGGVLAHLTTFKVKKGEESTTEMIVRESKDKVQVIGGFDSESLFTDLGSSCTLADGSCRKSILAACGRGYYVVGILGVGQEPTNHALNDIAKLKDQLEKWGRKIVLLFPDEEAAKKFNAESFGKLPDTVIYGIDTNGIQDQIAASMKLQHKNLLPIFIIADTFNRVVFVSQGYTIGLGEQIMKVVNGL